MAGLYLDFLRYSIHVEDFDDSHFLDMDWRGLYEFGKRQSILGILFVGIEKMKKTDCIDLDILLRFIGAAQRIKTRNKLINTEVVRLREHLESAGFRVSVLKGQGVAMMYDKPFLRTPGDVDVWTVEDDLQPYSYNLDKSRDHVINYVRREFPKEKICYHHMGFHIFTRVKVELHFTPTWMGCYWHNRELQRWMVENWGSQSENRVMLPEAGEVAVPTKDFNVIYLLIHIFRHVLSEGVGIRQLMDYYYLLMNLDIRSGEYTELLHRFGLVKIAGAVMWVLGDVFMLPRERMIAVPNEKRGRRLLNVVINGGNFGLYDKGIDRSQGRSMRYFLDKFVYRGRLLADYPNEVAWSYLFSSWQKLWKLWKGY